MGMWIELFVFGLVFVFAWHQFRDLKREKARREKNQRDPAQDAASAARQDDPSDH